MADWHGSCRSNYFRVNDRAAFVALLDRFDVKLIEKDGLLGFLSEDQFGGVPTRIPDDDDVCEESISLLDEIGEHIAPGSVCVVQEIGAERLRCLTGRAWAIAGPKPEQTILVDLDDIYVNAAKAFGVQPSTATY